MQMTNPVPSEVTIRAATRPDAAAISGLITHLSLKFITPDYSADGEKTLLSHQTPAAIEGVMNRGTRYWVAEGADGLVGVVAVTASTHHLYHLFVAESHHLQGLGRRLFEHARQECLQLGNPGEFTVNASRYAVPFYRSLGFDTVGPESNRDGVISQPMWLLID
jgi:GNAT superfamily N-acetyltransferase